MGATRPGRNMNSHPVLFVVGFTTEEEEKKKWAKPACKYKYLERGRGDKTVYKEKGFFFYETVDEYNIFFPTLIFRI